MLKTFLNEFLLKAFTISPISTPFALDKFFWNSKVPSKVEPFAWPLTNKKVNTNNMIWVRRPYKVINLD